MPEDRSARGAGVRERLGTHKLLVAPEGKVTVRLRGLVGSSFSRADEGAVV